MATILILPKTTICTKGENKKQKKEILYQTTQKWKIVKMPNLDEAFLSTK